MFSVLCVLALVQTSTSVNDVEYLHTHNSFRDDSYACLGDCVNSKCVTDWKGNKLSCSAQKEVATFYKTVHNYKCYSNCGYFGNNFPWCVINVNGLIWEECTKNQATTMEEKIQTNDVLYVCKDECAKRGEEYYWCHTYSTFWKNHWEKCDPSNKVLVFNYPTVSGSYCVSRCAKYDGVHKCFNKDYDWETCILNPDKTDRLTAYAKALHEQVGFGVYTEKGYKKCKDRKKRFVSNHSATWPEVRTVRDIVLDYEGTEHYPTRYAVRDPGPVISYTVMPVVRAAINFILPLALRAVIRSRHLRPSERRPNIPTRVTNNVQALNQIIFRKDGNVDERGHLLASVLGGPFEAYNFIPQSFTFNRGSGSRWYSLEQHLVNFLNNTLERYVEWQAAVAYNFQNLACPYRPVAVAISVRRYSQNGTLYNDDNQADVLDNLYFSNNPEDSCREFLCTSEPDVQEFNRGVLEDSSNEEGGDTDDPMTNNDELI